MEVGDNFTALDGPCKGRKFNIKQKSIDDNRVDAAEYKLNKKGEIAPQKGRPRKFTYAEVSKWFENGPMAVPANSPEATVQPRTNNPCVDAIDGDTDILDSTEMEAWKAFRASSPEELKTFIAANCTDKSTSDDW